ncbi:hypothetical protein PRIO_6537 [Paenibacillus riograndensis SBR5]|uniref:Uncharacterized protein n=1 Tax=Paenibacillus riograndensis SBR5 TaxID=1073571 RepID=A0A0E4HFR5_9BACL|nr:hypothetical protein PRIO_6537 [Paenibacillus riograndensis SBR5]
MREVWNYRSVSVRLCLWISTTDSGTNPRNLQMDSGRKSQYSPESRNGRNTVDEAPEGRFARKQRQKYRC